MTSDESNYSYSSTKNIRKTSSVNKDGSRQWCWPGFFFFKFRRSRLKWLKSTKAHEYAYSWQPIQRIWVLKCIVCSAVTYGPEEGTRVEVVPVAGADLAGVKLGELPGGTSWVNASGWLILFRDTGRHSAGVSWTRPICSSWENPLGVTEL